MRVHQVKQKLGIDDVGISIVKADKGPVNYELRLELWLLKGILDHGLELDKL